MKKNIYLLAVLLCIADMSMGQNSFYDAKKLSKWSSLDHTIKKEKAAEYYAILMGYGNPSDFRRPQLAGIEKDIVKFYNLKMLSLREDKTIFNALKSNRAINYPPLQDAIDAYEREKADSLSFANASVTFLAFLKNGTNKTKEQILSNLPGIDTLLVDLQPVESIYYTQHLNDTIPEKVVFVEDSFNSAQLKLYSIYNSQINTKKSIYATRIAEDYAFVLKVFFDAHEDVKSEITASSSLAPGLVTTAKRARDEFAATIAKTQTAINFDKLEQTESFVKSSISDQNFPSQSEIIDALAIYISRRFKQEVAFTFVENFTKHLKNNILAQELFPVTYSMLNNQDPYTMPRLGSEWRNAVSSDLLYLPEHLVNSSIIRNWIKNDVAIDYLSDAVLMGKYIAKKYTFVDMMRSLYERNGLESDTQIIRSSFLKKGIVVSYIINQEFFDSTKTKYWITPEELYRLNFDQVHILGELIATKYDSVFSANFGLNPLDNLADIVKLKVRYTDLLATLKQFETSQIAAYQSHKDGGNLKDAFWDFQRILVDFLIKEVKNDNAKAVILNVQKIFYIYDYISAKNYGAAINTSLGILDTLLKKKSPAHYLRAFVSEQTLTDIENIVLKTGTAPELLKCFNQLEVLAKLERATLLLADGAANLTTIMDTYNKLFLPDLEILGSAYLTRLAGPRDGMIEKINNQFSVIKAEMKRIAGVDDQLLSLIENIEFHKPKNFKDLQSYMSLVDRLLMVKSPTLLANFRKISGFITDAAKARDSKELSSVLEMYAQPPLSYKLSRKSIMSIDLNAYLGAWGGAEFAFREVDAAIKNYQRLKIAGGLTVPIGVSLTWGNRTSNNEEIEEKIRGFKADSRLFYLDRKGKSTFLTGASHSLFISIVDLAGPVSFRLGNDEAKGLPQDTRWSQVLAPGIHYIMGLTSSPVCISLGFQVSPQLRSYDNLAGKPFTTGRFQLGFTYDMPLINFRRIKPF